MYFRSIFVLGSHGIEEVNVAYVGSNSVEITTSYFQHSTKRGALIFLTSEDMNFTKSTVLALGRATSLAYTLPFQLFPGQYKYLVYDIESDGTLHSGVEYPAFEGNIAINADSQG